MNSIEIINSDNKKHYSTSIIQGVINRFIVNVSITHRSFVRNNYIHDIKADHRYRIDHEEISIIEFHCMNSNDKRITNSFANSSITTTDARLASAG